MECNAGAINPRIHPVTASGSRDKGKIRLAAVIISLTESSIATNQIGS